MTKVFILTGASRGIGLAIAHYLLEQSSKVVLVARNESALRKIEAQYEGQTAVLAGDLADLSLAKKAVELALSNWQQLDGVIVNHGTLTPVKRVADSTAEEWRASFDVNYFSAVALAQASIPALRRSQGAIIFTSSGAATNGYTAWGAYGSAKAGINHLAMTLGSEEPDIVSIAVRPGVVDTEMQIDIREKYNGVMDEKDAARFADLKTNGGLLKPEQPGHIIARLALEPPKELSGQFLTWNSIFQD